MVKGSKIKRFLWFEDQAEEAAKFYVSIFKDAKQSERVMKAMPGMVKLDIRKLKEVAAS